MMETREGLDVHVTIPMLPSLIIPQIVDTIMQMVNHLLMSEKRVYHLRLSVLTHLYQLYQDGTQQSKACCALAPRTCKPRWFESLSPRDLNPPFTMAYHPTVGALRLPAAQVHRQIIDLDLLPSDRDHSFCHYNDPLFVAVDPDAAAQEWRAAFGRQADFQVLLAGLYNCLFTCRF
jgi:hypothetical protein